MPEFYDDMAALAIELIEEFGRPMVLVSETRTGPRRNPTVTETRTDVIGVQTTRRTREDGGLVVSTADWVLLDSRVEPTVDMRLSDGATTYSIVDREEVKPGPTTVLYKIKVAI